MIQRRPLLLAATAAAAALMFSNAHAQGGPTIKIGEINSYKAQPAFLEPYKKGMELAIEEINAAGGVNGKKLELITRDDNASPGDAVRAAEELVSREKIDVLAGAFLSNTGLALTDFAKQKKFFYLAGEPLTDKIIWGSGNKYTFRLRPGTYMQSAMLVEEAAKLPAKTWATVAPNYEYGQSAVKWFKQLLSAKRPDVTFVAEQWPALGRIDAGATVGALAQSRPDAIFNVTFGADLTNFVRQGNTRGLFEKRSVVSMLTGEPEYLDPLGDETPEGWIVTGYPQDTLATPEHAAFADAYRAKFSETPRCGSVVGFALIQAIAAGMVKSGGTDTEKMAEGFKGAAFGTPFGRAMFRPQDHQATLGAFVGTLTQKNGKGVMTGWRYVDGAAALPSDEAVKAMRPG
jgi:branched-chain amino acid transport system substrate-binding protein